MTHLSKLDYRRLEEIASRVATCEPYPDDTPEKQRKRIKNATAPDWDAFNFFATTYFPHITGLPFARCHKIMFNTVEASPGITAITGFRGLGKSAIFGYIYPVWKIIKGEKYVIFGAANIEQSKEKADFIVYEFENNARLIADFPFLKIKDSDGEVYYLANNTKIRAVSIKQTIRGTINARTGKRPGLIILDDIDEETNVGNMTIGKRKLEKITQEVRGALDPSASVGDGHDRPASAKILWLGNLTHPNFAICQFKKLITDEIIAQMPDSHHHTIPHSSFLIPNSNTTRQPLCLQGSEKRLLQIPLERNGKSMWAAQYPTASIPALKKELGMTGFLREMQGQSLIDGTIFKASWFIGGKQPPDKDLREIWLYIDPAWGTKGCYKSIFAIGYDGYMFHVLKAWCRQCENSKMFDYLYQTFGELRKRFGLRVRFSYEANFGQTRLMSDFDRWCVANGVTPISHYFKPINNTQNKNLRIEALEPVIESGKVIFPEGQDMPTVIGQFTAYPQGYIDACDALAGCLERFTNYGKQRHTRIRGGFYA